MTDSFFDGPILNSPYEYPSRHWELDESRQPTHRILDRRRRVSFVSPIPGRRRSEARSKPWFLTRKHTASRPKTSNTSWRKPSTESAVPSIAGGRCRTRVSGR